MVRTVWYSSAGGVLGLCLLLLLTACGAAVHSSRPMSSSASLPMEPAISSTTPRVANQNTTPAARAATPTPKPPPTHGVEIPRLREVWHIPSEERTPTHALVYSEVISSNHVFWRVDVPDLTQRTPIISFPRSIQDDGSPRFGLVSPDGTWIAYLRQETDANSLYVVQSDGSQNRLVAEGLGLGSNVRGVYRFVWSPDGHRLAFRKHRIHQDHEVHDVYVYEPQTDDAPRRVTTISRVYPVGWVDTTHILVITNAGQGPKFESIHALTGTPRVLEHYRSNGRLVFREMSPDRQKVLLGWDKGTSSVLDISSHHYHNLDIVAHQSFWGTDSATLLEIPLKGDGLAQIVSLTHPDEPLRLTLLPSFTASSHVTAQSLSPDGRYLVVQEHQNRRTRTLLYDCAKDQWHTIAEPDPVLVLGWLAHE
jgi:hypothetical protein